MAHSVGCLTGAMGGLMLASGCKPRETPIGSEPNLYPDPEGILALPEGFTATMFSTVGQEMDDGLLVPAAHDGMACFALEGSQCLLVRNHEITTVSPSRYGAFGPNNERHAGLSAEDRSKLYDLGTEAGVVCPGGTTTLLFDLKEQQLLGHWLSLGGTGHNCSGGPTPWGSWISCEEWVQRADTTHARDHGWAFDVRATAKPELLHAEPLTGLGRFLHEAVAIDPKSGIVYETEDREDGCFYRFVPEKPSALNAGGRLQALAIADTPSMDTRNWSSLGSATVLPLQRLDVRWIDLENTDSPDDDLRHRAFNAGAARFSRAEGIWFGDGELFFACTTGGPQQIGQIWRFIPGDSDDGGVLELFLESGDASLIENADNLTIAPNGDLYVCEDGPLADGITRVTPEGAVQRFAMNSWNTSELAGPCFSPDGSTMFVNVQHPGITIAIQGPWPHHQLRNSTRQDDGA